MVNYLYDLDHIEENHETFANRGEVVVSPAVRKLARIKPRERAVEPPAIRSPEP
jgi:malonyl-CoA decarboxylase